MFISENYRKLNRQYHESHDDYGAGGHRWADYVELLAARHQCVSILDYGSGKGTLRLALQPRGFEIDEYDPCVPGREIIGRDQYDLVVCTDVMEHIELSCLEAVTEHVASLANKCALLAISMKPTGKKRMLADGTPKHRSILSAAEWRSRFGAYGKIEKLPASRDMEVAFVLHKPKKRYHVIERMVKENGWTAGAEVGVFRGENLFYLLEHCPDLHMVAIDLWEGVPFEDVEKSHETGKNNYHKYPLADIGRDVENRVAAEFSNRCRIARVSSDQPPAWVPDSSLDFVFIDACHETAQVIRDIKAWVPKLKRTGMLMGHDHSWKSVRDAINKTVPGWRSAKDSVWYIERKNVKL